MNLSIISNFYEQVKNLYYSTILHDYDLPIILRFFNKYSHPNRQEIRVLDVGCGYGKKMIGLMSEGYDVLGVEVNQQIVEANQNQGLNCLTVEEFLKRTDKFDIILMSHIIEHFHPSDLKDFMDSYLDRLKVGGYLIIATPLLNKNFYDDFDHIKPYSPVSIIMVFGNNSSQVQYYSRNKLHLTDIKFRKRHFWFNFVRGKYVRGLTTKIYQVLEFTSALLCQNSFGWLGKKDGWVGVFRKTQIL